ncbi:hypothetical protein O6P43_010282 [Quillaja saponaria]|uniref:Uncharacterized protein n=1 Tax=Quillaja saponaria TaxID=32244 RepID=A0AAD7VEA4_QUISA|nr:hypothetical protein O6P43_010282 [Quillaja saponaria]
MKNSDVENASEDDQCNNSKMRKRDARKYRELARLQMKKATVYGARKGRSIRIEKVPTPWICWSYIPHHADRITPCNHFLYWVRGNRMCDRGSDVTGDVASKEVEQWVTGDNVSKTVEGKMAQNCFSHSKRQREDFDADDQCCMYNMVLRNDLHDISLPKDPPNCRQLIRTNKFLI